ncbi:protein mothers against dpp [Tribolium castaneum]|uniref:SMAD family member-like protein n=1 Tax=Tribolium castaneum TaxID=7070 RepID=D6WRP2_TRICA|nr:PREDICTED: protein mothers against dpp [Tribolium castaneum]XP_008195998.1 PREDICTED: protein mothers against dpp [Tribolium castaneum]EFA07433.1 SMAD family member-like protein [Tribolium castaneum]|eukprot:XP_008195997.1 PREDICTED: protein mothers against dpp [Tribolium castaneum]
MFAAGKSLPDASSVYHEISCRLGDEQSNIERHLYKLLDQLQTRTDLSAYNPHKCLTVSRKLPSSESRPFQVIHGQVWRWSHLRRSLSHLIFELQPRNFCFSAHQMEICLNPCHYRHHRLLPPLDPVLASPVWATIYYYEKGSRIGDAFPCQGLSAWVHCLQGGPQRNDRFNLFEKENAGREWTVKNTRQQIGRGITLHYVKGQIYVQLWSDSDLYVNSRFYNRLKNYPGGTICKLSPFRCRHMKLFRDDEFHEMLSAEVAKGWEAVYSLAKVCTVRISFVEGWGNEVGGITEKPCWLEVRFLRHLEWTQRTLTQMGAPYKLHY